jgi:hypothetical protein
MTNLDILIQAAVDASAADCRWSMNLIAEKLADVADGKTRIEPIPVEPEFDPRNPFGAQHVSH